MYKLVIICGLGVAFASGCSSNLPPPTPQQPVSAPLQASFITVENPVGEMCRDDTLSLTEWFNVPVARFAGTSIELNGRNVTPDALFNWGKGYYERKTERVLYVQIAQDGMVNAEHALEPLSRLHPDLMLRRVDFGFTCPKLQK